MRDIVSKGGFGFGQYEELTDFQLAGKAYGETPGILSFEPLAVWRRLTTRTCFLTGAEVQPIPRQIDFALERRATQVRTLAIKGTGEFSQFFAQ
jgi:hypothetical protein